MSATAWPSLLDVPPVPVQWLWDGRIPRGKVTLLEGAAGIGKSSLALDLAARVSRGATMPVTRGPAAAPGEVVIFSGDDGMADTVRPRLEAAGADLSHIHPIAQEVAIDQLNELKPALIVLDPLTAYLCVACEETPRQLVATLSRMAIETGAAVLAVQCLPDQPTSEWQAELRAAARSVLAVSSIEHSTRRVVVRKSNLRPASDIRPLIYHLGDVGGVVRIVSWADAL